MTIAHPFDTRDPRDELRDFVSARLREQGVEVEEAGPGLKTVLDEVSASVFGLPGAGQYLLKFDPRDVVEPFVDPSTTVVLVTMHHPLVEALTRGLDYVPVHYAEYRHENEIDLSQFLDWLTPPFYAVGATPIEIDDPTERAECSAVEVWLEYESRGNRGVFPVVVTRVTQNGQTRWSWSPDIQRAHVRRRGSLLSVEEVEPSLRMSLEEVERAIETAADVVVAKILDAQRKDGAFLRRLRRLRTEQMQRRIAKQEGQPREIITSHDRRIREYRREISTPPIIAVNSAVVLRMRTMVTGELVFQLPDGGPKVNVLAAWHIEDPAIVRLKCADIDLDATVPLELGRPVEAPPTLARCPNCGRVTLASGVREADYGSGTYCVKCHIECAACGAWLAPDAVIHHSFTNAPLCPDHAVRCEASGVIVQPDETVVVNGGKRVYRAEASECAVCAQNGAANPWWLASSVSHHSLTGAPLCPQHTAVCSVTGRVYTPSEVVELASGKTVARDLAEECEVCAKSGRPAMYLKSSMRQHSKRGTYLCKRHAVKSDVTGDVIATTESRRLADGRIAERSLSARCELCREETGKDLFYLKSEMLEVEDTSGRRKRTTYYCKGHQRHCWLCQRTRPDKDFQSPFGIVIPVCPDCAEVWDVEAYGGSLKGHGCALCRFIQPEGEGRDKCPRCDQKRLEQAEGSTLALIRYSLSVQAMSTVAQAGPDGETPEIAMLPLDKCSFYSSSRERIEESGRYVLAVERRMLKKDRWWLIDPDGNVVAHSEGDRYGGNK